MRSEIKRVREREKQRQKRYLLDEKADKIHALAPLCASFRLSTNFGRAGACSEVNATAAADDGDTGAASLDTADCCCDDDRFDDDKRASRSSSCGRCRCGCCCCCCCGCDEWDCCDGDDLRQVDLLTET